MLQISAHWFVSSRLRYGEFSMPWRRYTRLPIRIWISAGTKLHAWNNTAWVFWGRSQINKRLSYEHFIPSWRCFWNVVGPRVRASKSKIRSTGGWFKKKQRESQLKLSLKNVRMLLLYLHCTSLVLRGEGLEVPGILQGLHLVADSPTEQADEVQAVQLEF